MEKLKVRISVRNLVEFILRSGDLDNSRGSSGDKEAMLKGGRLHRKIQRSMKGNYQAEVSLKRESEYEDVIIQVEGRADGIFTEDGSSGLMRSKAPMEIFRQWRYRYLSTAHRQCVTGGFTEKKKAFPKLGSR